MNFLFGLIQIFTYVFEFSIPNALHAETIENGMYFVTIIYGIIIWVGLYEKNLGLKEAHQLRAKSLNVKGNIITAAIFVVLTIAYWILVANVPFFGKLDSDPFLDSITSVPAYIAQILLILGYREQWIYWLILDVFSVVLAVRAGSLIMTVQFIFWTANCIYGWITWTKLSGNKGGK